jgi:hypothetical protein
MAFTKTQLEALKNALLASNQPITAPIHREFAQKIIDELYDAQSRANLLSAIQNDSSLLTTDSVFVIRNGQGFLIPSSQVGGTGSLANLTDTVIIDPQDGEVIIYNSVTEKWENRVAGVVFNDFYVRHDIDNQGLDATQKSNATTNIGAQSILEKGQIDGYASLDGTGRVPSSQLPSFVDDVLEFPTLGDFPVTGESGKIYIALDTNKTYRWGGTTYVEISAGVVLGETETTAYRGDRGKIAYDYSQIGHLPLTGGTLASSGSTNTLNIDHASGSGLALNITKAGNDEGLKVVKTSGSGLAASITGGVTLLDELNLTTKLADAHIASAATWNAKIGGTIATGQVAFGTGAGVIGGDARLIRSASTLTIGVNANNGFVDNAVLDIIGSTDNVLFPVNHARTAAINLTSHNQSGGVAFKYTNTIQTNFAGNLLFINNSITKLFISGTSARVGILNSNPAYTLDVTGTFRNTTGAILASDLGSVLIGTTTDAGFRLDVNGTARIVGATRIDNLAGTGTRMVVADANGVMSTQALGIGGSGTLNRLAKFTAAGTVGDSQVFDNGTNVGIGTDSPSLLFSVLNKVGIDNDGRLFWGSDFSGNNRGLLTWEANSARIQSGSTSTSLDFAIGTGDIRMRLSTNNNLLINTTTDAGFRLDVNGTARATAFFTSSDKRKKDIISQDGELATYQFKGDDQIHYGYIAQDMEDLYPNQVSTDNDGMLSLNYIEILVKKVHDLESKLKRHGLD